MTKRRVILILLIVAILGVIGGGIWYTVRRNRPAWVLARAQINLKNRQFDRALELARQYTQRLPDDWRGYSVEGYAQIGRAAYAEARTAFEKARSLNASEIEIAIGLSRTHSLPVAQALSSDDLTALEGAITALVSANETLDAWLSAEANASPPRKSAELGVKEEKGLNLAKMAAAQHRKAGIRQKAAETQRTVGNAERAIEEEKEASAASALATTSEKESLSLLKEVFTADATRDQVGRIAIQLCVALDDSGSLSQIRQAVNALSPQSRPPASAVLLALQDFKSLAEDPYAEGTAKKRNEIAKLLDDVRNALPDDAPDRAFVTVASADVALMRGQPDNALLLCDQVLKRNRRQGQARLIRGKALIRQGHVAQAEQELLSLKTEQPLWEEAQYVYAMAATMSGKPESAREALRKIVRDINPKSREALRSLTAYELATRSYDQAVLDAKACYDAYPEDPESVRLIVRAAYHTQQPVLARSVLEKSDVAYATNPQMLLAVADGWELLGETGKASDAIRRACAVKPATIDDLKTVALALIRDGRTSEAEKLLYDARTANPNHPVIHYLLGKILSATQRYLQAIEEYHKAIALDPGNDAYLVELAWACSNVGDLDGAEEALQKIQLPDENAQRLATDIRVRKGVAAGDTGMSPTDAGLDNARYYLTIGQPGKCIEICEAEIKKAGDRDDSSARWLLGRAYLVQGKRDDCLREWAKVIKARPLDLFIYREIAAVRIQTETPEQVEAAFVAIPEAKRELIDATMGWIFQNRQDFNAAAERYRMLAERRGATEDQRNTGWMLRIQALANGGKLDEAILETAKVSGTAPWLRQALWTKAQLLLMAKRTPEAESILRDLQDSALQARDLGVLRNVARMYAGIGQSDKAVGVCDEMLKLLPNDAQVCGLRASILTGAGNLEEAAVWYRKAIDRQPGNIEYHLSLARVLDLHQDSQQALDVLRQLQGMGDTGRQEALYAEGDLMRRWGLEAQAVAAYEQLSKLGYGKLPRVNLALGRAFASLGMNDRATQVLEGIPKSSSEEYVASRQFLAEIADTTEKKLNILTQLNLERPGLVSVMGQQMRILAADKRYAESVAAYRSFRKALPAGGSLPAEVELLALYAMLNAGDNKSAAELSARMAERNPRSSWCLVAALLLANDDPAKAARLLPMPADADFSAALLALAASRMSGNPSLPWTERISQIDREMGSRKPPGSIQSHYRVMAYLANGGVKEAEAELARFQSYRTVGKNVATELVSHAKGGSDVSAEAVGIIRATVALDLGFPTIAYGFATDVLKRRPASQWAAALAARSAPDAAARRQVIETLTPKDCVVARMIQASLASGEKDYAKSAEVYRSIADAERDNVEVLSLLASAETSVGNLDKAAAIHQRIWQIAMDPYAANNYAYLAVQLWPQDRAKLADAATMIEAAIKQQPNMAGFLDTQGWIAHLLGDDAKALRSLRQAVKGLPGSIEVHAHLGVVEAATGNKQLAAWHVASAIANAERIKAKGEPLSPEQLQGLQIAQKAQSELTQPGK